MFIKNKKGLVILEAIPIIWVMFVLMGATLGSWGIVHTAVLNSIAARNYTFFLFNNRADLSYLRDFSETNEYRSAKLAMNFTNRYFKGNRGKGRRFSYINKENPGGTNKAHPTQRPVSFGDNLQSDINDNDSGEILSTSADHNQIHRLVPLGRNKKKVKKAWIMVGYGICLCATCDSNCD